MEIITVSNLIKPRKVTSVTEEPSFPSPPYQHAVSDLRYERKYAVHGMRQKELNMILKLNPAVFSPVYEQRYINNIYLDTPFLHGFHDTVAGVSHRKKIRIRWYGEMMGFIKSPVLEFKIKKGLAGYKISLPLPSFTLSTPFTKNSLVDLLVPSILPAQFNWQLDALEPTLLNRYLRDYYLTGDNRFRATIDTQLTFHDIFQPVSLYQRKVDSNLSVVELKYALEDDKDANLISSAFPFRLSKNSKYAMGINLLRQ